MRRATLIVSMINFVLLGLLIGGPSPSTNAQDATPMNRFHNWSSSRS
jgi:hypothetical protein